MKQGNIRDTGDCRAISGVLARIGDKWSVLIVSRLGARPMRFNELKRDIEGISQKMLSMKLRALERDGLVSRTFFPVIPPRVEYELTTLGQQLLEPLAGLAEFALMHQFQVEHSRRRFDEILDQGVIAVAATTTETDRRTR